MEERIKLLNPHLTGDCKELILNELDYLDSLKNKISELAMEKNKFETIYNQRSKVISSMVGTVFEYVQKEQKVDYTVNKTNILFNNVNGGSKR